MITQTEYSINLPALQKNLLLLWLYFNRRTVAQHYFLLCSPFFASFSSIYKKTTTLHGSRKTFSLHWSIPSSPICNQTK